MAVARSRAVLSSALLVVGLSWAAPALADGAPVSAVVTADSVDDSTVTSDPVTDATTGWRLEKDPSECINSNPRPNCGYKPQDAGERGGWLQITLFFVLMAALGVIFTVIIRNVVRRDRAIAEQIRRSEVSSAPSDAGESPRPQ